MSSKFVVTNDFHNTEVTLILSDDNKLTGSQVRRARRVLCGISTCKCGGALGERPSLSECLQHNSDGTITVLEHEPQEVDIDISDFANYIG